MSNEFKEKGFIRRTHITTAIGIIAGTASLLAWLNTTYVSASDFAQFKVTTISTIKVTDLNGRKLSLQMRNRYLEDKVLEMKTNDAPIQQAQAALLDRHLREIQANEKEIENIQFNIDRVRGQ